MRPRSGLAAKHGVTVLNSPGTIDAGYRGEIKVTIDHDPVTHAIQLHAASASRNWWWQRVEQAELNPVDSLPETGRGSGGFGSTGR